MQQIAVRDKDQNIFQWSEEMLRRASGGIVEVVTEARNILEDALIVDMDCPSDNRSWFTNGWKEIVAWLIKEVGLQRGTKYCWSLNLPEATDHETLFEESSFIGVVKDLWYLSNVENWV